MTDITKEHIIEKVKEIATRLGVEVLRVPDFVRESGIPKYLIYSMFPEGGWSTVLAKAGLKSGGSGFTLEDDDLLNEFHRVVTELGKIPTWHLFQSRSKISGDNIRKRFGGTQGTLKRYRSWLEENWPDSPFLELMSTMSSNELPDLAEETTKKTGIAQVWNKTTGPEFGAPISFRGLTHAPINEQGVVYLFGMVSYELGFIVEAIHPAFPDCEAKRCVDSKKKRWQRVRIEFEYVSSNFRQHGHDPQQCDLIVCWEHNWQECPLEVLELRTILKTLRNDENTQHSSEPYR
ncbi:MAG: hypothetical protein HY807_03180 [Nitrospirae bacterium]|nr:hypothetical protein [Nitrospirota bacterium]